MTDWAPATEAESAMREALREENQELYFQVLSQTDLLLPIANDMTSALTPMGWGTWTTGGRTHVLAFTSPQALRACLAQHAGSTRQVPYRELAASWPNLEWWLAVDPGLPIEGYLPAWFVAQLARGEVQLPGRTLGARARLASVQSASRARATVPVPGLTVRPEDGELVTSSASPTAPARSAPAQSAPAEPGPAAAAPAESVPEVTPAGLPRRPLKPRPAQTPEAPPALGAPSGARSATPTPSIDTAGMRLAERQANRVAALAKAAGSREAAGSRNLVGSRNPAAAESADVPAPGPSNGGAPPYQGGVAAAAGQAVKDGPVADRVVQPDDYEAAETARRLAGGNGGYRAADWSVLASKLDDPPQTSTAGSATQTGTAGSATQASAAGGVPQAGAPGDSVLAGEAGGTSGDALESSVTGPPGLAGFVPANDLEEELLAAAGDGSTDSFLSTLLLARVLLPLKADTPDGAASSDGDLAWRTDVIDGEPYVVVFTSKERLRAHLDEEVETASVKFVQLIRNWPADSLSFAVNPGTPVGATLPGTQIVALANWAKEVGLGDDSDDGKVDQAPIEAAGGLPGRSRTDAQAPTTMQKTIAPGQVDYYLDRGYDRVSGFVHRANEVEHLQTPRELLSALGLLYPGSPFSPDADEIFVLRWPAHRPSLYRIPYGGQSEAAMRAMEGWVIERSPFRGNGFAPGESTDVVAEFKVDSARLPHGSQLWRLSGDGSQRLVAVLDADSLAWRKVED